MNGYRILADLVVCVHLAYVLFVVFGQVAIVIGLLLKRRWVRNFWFRAIHLLMIGVVVFEAALGIVCPLTRWENRLRAAAGQEGVGESFIEYWTHRMMFYQFEPWVFTLIYCAFGATVAAAFAFGPPDWPKRKSKAVAEAKLPPSDVDGPAVM